MNENVLIRFILEPSTYSSRMAGFSLYVSNTTSKNNGRLCFHETQKQNGTPLEDQRINCSVHGRYVIYYNERLPSVKYPSYYSPYAYYELCELEVYGESTVIFFIKFYRNQPNIVCNSLYMWLFDYIHSLENLLLTRRYMAEILPIRHKTSYNQSYTHAWLFI